MRGRRTVPHTKAVRARRRAQDVGPRGQRTRERESARDGRRASDMNMVNTVAIASVDPPTGESDDRNEWSNRGIEETALCPASGGAANAW